MGMTKAEAGKLGWLKTRDSLLSHQKKQRQEAVDRWTRKKCLYCKVEIPYEKRDRKFCCHSHAARHNNSGRLRVRRSVCLECSEPLTRRSQEKYCSKKCQHSFQWKLKKHEIERSGVIGGGQDRDWAGCARRFLIETCGRQCEVCRFTEWNGKPVPLILDHIDGHSENWKVSNLRLVCGNCDMQLPTYKGKNKGNGRFSRIQRYRAGKSF